MLGSLTLDQLRVIVAISETGSFSAAGRRLLRVQSAISQSVQALETSQNVQVFDRSNKTPRLTEAGRVLVAQARQILRQTDRFESIAGAIAGGLEPELTLAVDSLVPTQPIIESLRALALMFPDLPVTLYTEGFGITQRRLRDRSVALAICVLQPTTAPDLQAHPLTSMTLVPVVSASHPLARDGGTITRERLMDHVQLVLTDPVDPGGPSHGVISARIWRFVDQGRRLDFVVAGFGWANMPSHLVAPYLADGRLVDLGLRDPGITPDSIPVYAVHDRSHPPRKATRWLLDDLRDRLSP